MNDHGLGVTLVDMKDHVIGSEGPNELHLPLGVVSFLLDTPPRRKGLQLSVESAVSKLVGSLDIAVLGEVIVLDRVMSLPVHDNGRVTEDEPSAHEALEIDGLRLRQVYFVGRASGAR